MEKIKVIGKQAVILLLSGIFVSAFWDFLIKDTFVRIGKWLVEFSSNFSNTFTDFIYTSFSSSDMIFTIFPSLVIFIGIIVIITFRLLSVLYRMRKSNLILVTADTDEQSLESESKLIKADRVFFKYLPRVNLVLYFISLISYTLFFSMLIFQNSLKTVSERNLGILKPYFTTNKYDLLYSEYLQIRTKNDFKEFQIQLEKIAKTQNIKIKDPSN
ncbi:hypothetical protein [Sphingobacterium sp. UBA6320]|uniref:hypothetical protein n=1 Tax=Sphingobacterium sp. UBA6320 TaxID=1947510 RepID=UPI0025E8A1E9|nr:hypothetical protein [Sphingobacterium sp. UBA6320]